MAFITEEEMARELADKSRNPIKGTHPYDLPDEKAYGVAVGAETPGIETKDWDKTDEELDQVARWGETPGLTSRNLPLSSENSRRKSNRPVSTHSYKVLGRGGGLGMLDIAEEQRENTDPEVLEQLKEYKTYRKRGGKLNWGNWLENSKGTFARSDFEERKHKGVMVNLRHFEDSNISERNRFADVYDKLVDLSRIWGDAKTGIAYKVSPNGFENDQLVFVNKDLGRHREGREQMAIPVKKFNEVLGESGIRMRIERPSDKRQDFRRVIHNLRFGPLDFQGKIAVEFPDNYKEQSRKVVATKEDSIISDSFNIKLYQPAVEKYASAEQADALRKFIGAWPDSIQALGYNVEKGAVSEMIVQLKPDEDGRPREPLEIPAYLVRTCLLVDKFPPGSPTPRGLLFRGGARLGAAHIDQNSTESDVRDVMSKVAINGKRLNQDVSFFIAKGHNNVPSAVGGDNVFSERVPV